MRLINVRVFLDIEEGKRVPPDTNVLEHCNDEQLANMKYAILSHCWGAAMEEINFREVEMLLKMGSSDRKKLRQRRGYQKILKSCERAYKDQLKWLWVDTCCINAESSSELSEAINSMFRWYEGSEKCYAYLHDVEAEKFPTRRNEKLGESGGWPKWFSRGWTLQELVAPSVVQFFNQHWQFIGDKNRHTHTLKEITRIPSCILQYGLDADRLSVAQIMSWAADRKTTRVEDRAYSLLGLFGVHMPMLYGEGKNAFHRLQLELIRTTNDHSVFAWDRKAMGWSGSVLADDPGFFRDCDDVVKMEPDEYLDALKEGGEEVHTTLEEPLRTYSVTNAGIQIWLPLKRSRGSHSLFEARLACRRSLDSSPITIMLASFKSNYYRHFGHFQTIHGATAEFRLIYLAYREETRRKDCTFKFDDRAITCEGFVRRCVFPREVGLTGNSLTLSNIHHSASIVYANSKTNACFVIAVGYCLGHEWARVIFDPPAEKATLQRPPGILDPSWYAYVEQAYSPTTISPGHTHCIVQARSSAVTHLPGEGGLCLMKHAHLPRSIKGVQIFYQRLPQPSTCLITIDIIQCTGCCVAPDAWQTLDGVWYFFYWVRD
ncbi:heterokaryon incompatibility protein-domain-containing protein [Scleroderma yunnanense]